MIAVWLIIYSPLFEIKEVSINSTSQANIEELSVRIWSHINKGWIWPQKNILIFNAKNLSNNLKNEFHLKNIDIDKKYFHNLIVSFDKKNVALIWQEDGRYFYIDADGDIIAETDLGNSKKGEYIVIENLSTIKIANDKIYMLPENIGFAIKLFKELASDKYGLIVHRYYTDNDIYSIKIKIENGPDVYFSTKENLIAQVENLMQIKNNILKDDFFKLSYIGLGNGNQIYYK